MPDKIAEMMETLNDLKERVEEIENILGVENDEDEDYDADEDLDEGEEDGNLE